MPPKSKAAATKSAAATKAAAAKSAATKSAATKSVRKRSSPDNGSSKTKKYKSAPAAAAAVEVAPLPLAVHYYVHNHHVRPLIAIPINNPNLWPTPSAPFFRSTGTSNEGYGMFAGTWFPFISMKDKATMPNYLKSKQSGFIIKSGFLYGEDMDTLSPKQTWIHNLVDDYPIMLDENKQNFLKLTTLSITFKNLYDKMVKEKDITNPVYKDIILLLKHIVETIFTDFLKYFLYPWQVMVSRKIGGGYWTMNQELYNYIGEKLSSHDNINAPVVTIINYSNEKDTNIQDAIQFLQDNRAQMTIEEIHELEAKENAKVRENEQSLKAPHLLMTANIHKSQNKMETYLRRITGLETQYESMQRVNALLNRKK
jgi:hypothetical protein